MSEFTAKSRQRRLAWQPCDDSWARAVFKMAAFSNVPIVVMWTFVRNRMLPQIKQQQLEPYCNWYYYFFIFIFVFYFRIAISVISNDSETNNLSFTSQHFTSLFLAIYSRCYFSSSLNTRTNFGRHDLGFRATRLWISGDMTSGEMTFGPLDRKPFGQGFMLHFLTFHFH